MQLLWHEYMLFPLENVHLHESSMTQDGHKSNGTGVRLAKDKAICIARSNSITMILSHYTILPYYNG